MNDRDWAFAIGDLGDPLRDIADWMLPPYPSWLPESIRMGHINEPLFQQTMERWNRANELYASTTNK